MRFPPLNSLRAFEAAGRLLSFTRAANELNVTQAAISHQIRSLEENLGVKLFRRGHRGLLLTDAGQAYLPDVREAFQRLAVATDRLRASDAAGTLTVSVLPSFAARWLVPRLTRFRREHPEIDVRVSANEKLVDFDRDDVDVAIRYGRGPYPGLRADRIMTEEITPVCSPVMAAGPPPIKTPEDLRRHTLLHDDMRTDWAIWMTAAGLQGIDPYRGPGFNDSSMLLQAAVDGQGIALGRTALATDDLAAGRLVRLFDVAIPGESSYFLVYPERTASRSKLQAFRSWVMAEAARDVDAATDAPDPVPC